MAAGLWLQVLVGKQVRWVMLWGSRVPCIPPGRWGRGEEGARLPDETQYAQLCLCFRETMKTFLVQVCPKYWESGGWVSHIFIC